MDELQRFKSEINLTEYAVAQGYEIDKRESSRSSAVLRRGDDKIIVTTAPDGHGVYFSVRDDSDNGSIVDFVQKRTGLALGHVRQELRPWIGVGSRPAPVRPQEPIHKPIAINPDRGQIVAQWAKMQPAGQHPYLLARGIDPATLADPRFAPAIRTDSRGNAVFGHYDRDGITGFELKNEGFTGFSRGGQKSLWFSTNAANAEKLVIVESAIDALSFDMLLRDDQGDTSANSTGYISIGGSMSPQQQELVSKAIQKAELRGAPVLIATDADEPGEKLAEQLAEMGKKTIRFSPDPGMDWNDHVVAMHEIRAQEAQEAQRQQALQQKRPSQGYDLGW